MAQGTGKLSGKHLTENLRRLSSEAIDITPTGDPITRADVLAQLIWKQALGWTEEGRDDLGNKFRKVHPPVGWCQQYLFERMEGRSPQASAEETTGIKAADKVRDLAKQRINAMASIAVGPPKKKIEETK